MKGQPPDLAETVRLAFDHEDEAMAAINAELAEVRSLVAQASENYHLLSAHCDALAAENRELRHENERLRRQET